MPLGMEKVRHTSLRLAPAWKGVLASVKFMALQLAMALSTWKMADVASFGRTYLFMQNLASILRDTSLVTAVLA